MARKKNSHFQFKHFRIEQGRCAMKVTTDACLLGARAEVEESEMILDIGAGTGLLSLMAAQRSTADIHAVELDAMATEQAMENFTASPWWNRLKVAGKRIQDYRPKTKYDTILCNPPFFQNALKAPDERRTLARHTEALSFAELSEAINRLLSENGKAWLLLPVNSVPSMLAALTGQLCLLKTIDLRSSEQHENHRQILVLGKGGVLEKGEQLTVYSQPPEYTDQVKKLLSPYYLYL